MSGRKQLKWDYRALRDEWIDRRLRGEALSLKAYSEERQVSYGSLRNRGRSWREELERRSAEISREVAEVTSIDHTAMRVAVLREREPLRKLYMQQVSRWAKHLTDNPTERVPIKDLVALGNLLIRMAQVGAGLPTAADGGGHGRHVRRARCPRSREAGRRAGRDRPRGAGRPGA